MIGLITIHSFRIFSLLSRDDNFSQGYLGYDEHMLEKELKISSSTYQGISIPTGKANLLMIKAEQGFLGCGYFNLDVAERIGEAVALVTGVKTFDDMLEAEVFASSTESEKRGVKIGMKGREALPLLNG